MTRRPRPTGPGPAPAPAELADPRAPAVFSRRCATCVLRTDNRLGLRPGRLAEVIDQHRATGTALVCHETTYGQAPAEVLCRGYYDLHGAEAGSVQVLYRLGGHLREVDPPAAWP